MKIHHNPTLPITPQQLRPNRPLQLIHNLSRRHSLHKLALMLQIHIQRQYMPAKQVLAVRRVEPEGLDLAF
jgi:hypothetical protein